MKVQSNADLQLNTTDREGTEVNTLSDTAVSNTETLRVTLITITQ